MNWLKEKWFKLGLLSLGFLFVILVSYNQYLETKKHNLDVVSQMRICSTTYAGEDADSCINVAKQQAIPHDFYKKRGAGFED